MGESPGEGQIAKLKLVKRQMHGRGKIDLLQAQLLRAPSAQSAAIEIASMPGLESDLQARACCPNPSLDDDPRPRLLVGRENDPRTGHGVRKGFVVVESNAKLSADVGQLGWTDVPGAPGHMDSASKRQ